MVTFNVSVSLELEKLQSWCYSKDYTNPDETHKAIFKMCSTLINKKYLSSSLYFVGLFKNLKKRQPSAFYAVLDENKPRRSDEN